MQAALLAEQGIEGPPNVIEARDGFMQAFAFGRIDKARPIKLPPAAEYGITDCYIKPYAAAATSSRRSRRRSACCNDEKITVDDIRKVEVETYKIAAEHAHVPWDDFASAQLSFPYLMGLAARYRGDQVRAFRREDAEGSGVRRVRRQAHRHGAGRDRPALSAAAPGARHGDDRASGSSCARPTRPGARAWCRSTTTG